MRVFAAMGPCRDVSQVLSHKKDQSTLIVSVCYLSLSGNQLIHPKIAS